MKERLLPISILISGVLILFGLLTLSDTIRSRPVAGPASFPSSIELSANQASDFMSEWEAQAYLRINYDSFIRLLDEGKLKGTYVEIPVFKTVSDEQAYAEMAPVPDGAPSPAIPVIIVPGVERVFVRGKLDEWMLAQIAS